MLNQLRGRNLAHVGCTIGLVLGLVFGLIAALAILQFVRSGSALNWATIAWFGITFGLGALGYVLGGRTSQRLWGTDHRSE